VTLQELAQIVGGIGAISSFVYAAAIQISRNTRAVWAATYQQFTKSLTEQWDDMANSGELCNFILRGGDDLGSLDRVKKNRFRFLSDGVPAALRECLLSAQDWDTEGQRMGQHQRRHKFIFRTTWSPHILVSDQKPVEP
jgi:hypothetical protein